MKTSPGPIPKIVVSGMRESAQPIQRIFGAWPLADSLKKDGSDFATRLHHSALLDSARLNASDVNVSIENLQYPTGLSYLLQLFRPWCVCLMFYATEDTAELGGSVVEVGEEYRQSRTGEDEE